MPHSVFPLSYLDKCLIAANIFILVVLILRCTQDREHEYLEGFVQKCGEEHQQRIHKHPRCAREPPVYQITVCSQIDKEKRNNMKSYILKVDFLDFIDAVIRVYVLKQMLIF